MNALNNPCPISSFYTNTPASISCYKYRFSCSNHHSKFTQTQALHKTKGNPQVENDIGSNRKLVNSIVKGLIGFTAAVSVCLDSPAMADSMTIAFPASRTHEVNAVQRTLVETWGLIRETFVDPTFNHQDWDSKFQQTMVEMLPLRSADAAYGKIRGMISSLGDPFTRIISPKEYQSFRIGRDGNVQGVGIFVNNEPNTGHLVCATLDTSL